MKKIVLGLLELLLSFSLMMNNIAFSQETYPIMQPDRETWLRWMKDYEAAPKAPLDEQIHLRLMRASEQGVGTSLSLLSYLQYTPSERNQGSCGNCWVWAGTGIMEIAHTVQNGVKDRFSTQFLNSCKIGSYACCGGNLSDLAKFYVSKEYAIPWSNTSASFQDSSSRCSNNSSAVLCGNIATTPKNPITSITAQTITTTGVDQATAVANIKNILNQNKGVWFAFWLADNTDWNAFYSFWSQNEGVMWDPDPYCGHNFTSAGGGHAVLIVGYDDSDPNPANNYWIVLNSWGTASGNRPNGLFRMKMYLNYDCIYYYYGSWGYSNQFMTLSVNFSQSPSQNKKIVPILELLLE
jgi:C1A family cysteine protease